MRRLFLLIVLYGASVAAAQTTDVPKNARIEGQVLSTAGGPVINATIRLAGRAPTMYSQSSDNDGKFVFESLPPGTYSVITEKDGFDVRPSTPSAPMSLSSGQALKDWIVKLSPLAVITGCVTDQDRVPVANTQVMVLQYTYLGGRKQLSRINGPGGPTATAQTDDQGNYRISNLAPGHYYVSVSPIPPIALHVAERSGRETNITTYYPSTVDPATATPLNVTGGELKQGIDIRLQKGRVYSIRGKAVDSTNRGAAVNTLLMLSINSKEDDDLRTQLVPRADGTFELFSLTPGSYVLQVRPTVGIDRGSNFIGRSDVTIKDSDVDDVVLSLTPATPFDVVGSIKVEDGDFMQIASALQERTLLLLREVETMDLLWPKFKDDGTFRIPGVLLTKYSLDLTNLQSVSQLGVLTQAFYVKSVRFGGQDVTRAPLDFTAGASGKLEILLSGKTATVTGTIRDNEGNSKSSARVALWSKSTDPSSRAGFTRAAIVDANAGFGISGLAPGDYYVAAWEEADPRLLRNPDFLDLFIRDALSVKLGEGDSETVELRPITRDKTAAGVAALR